MMLLDAPVVVPVVVGLGYDPVWWGIVLTILIEAALITPPVGLNRLILLLIALPNIALWLPRLMMG